MSSHCENHVWLNDLKKIIIPENNTYFIVDFGPISIGFYNDDFMGLRNFFLCLAQKNPEVKVNVSQKEIKAENQKEIKEKENELPNS